MNSLLFKVPILLVSFAATSAVAATWYVDDSVSASGDGKSWPTAFKKIQKGIDASSDGDTVIVAEGTYVENIVFNGKNIVLRSTEPTNVDLTAKTIIDGNKAGSVVTFDGTEDETCVLEGFTIRNGETYVGGGVDGGTGTLATICYNMIIANSADSLGGGLAYCHGLIELNGIGLNAAMNFDGGGLCECCGTIQYNVIYANLAPMGGGLSECYDGTICGNIICNNQAPFGGGAFSDCGGIIEGNSIYGNSAEFGGGGAFTGCEATFQNNIIYGNSAPDGGGGAFSGCAGVFQNNLIAGNSAGWVGGGAFEGCEGTYLNNTIYGNSSEFEGGGFSGCDGTIRNCIIWANTAPEGNEQLSDCVSPTYSCIQDWTEGGEGNTIEDPRFVDADGPDDNPATYEDNNYRLRADSPCVDKGKNADWMLQVPDLDGNPRIFYGKSSHTVDMGAYELGSWPFRITEVSKPAGNVRLKWNSRPGDTYVIWSCVDLPAQAWGEVGTVASQGTETTWTEQSSTGDEKFYRVEVK
jgi:hypothetical protein